jgi:hypothetical protein
MCFVELLRPVLTPLPAARRVNGIHPFGYSDDKNNAETQDHEKHSEQDQKGLNEQDHPSFDETRSRLTAHYIP